VINDDREREELLRRERDEIHALGLNVRLELSDRTAVSLSSLPMAPDSRRNLMLPESIYALVQKKKFCTQIGAGPTETVIWQ
jgi:hypothetical protein